MMRSYCVLLLAAFAFTVAGCATTSGPQKQSGGARAAHVGGVSAAISMLYEGRVDESRKVLVKALERDPTDRRARGLLQQIDVQPEVLLGQESFRYRVRSGDTLSLWRSSISATRRCSTLWRGIMISPSRSR
jgi:Tfp pilus assembly protein PilF